MCSKFIVVFVLIFITLEVTAIFATSISTASMDISENSTPISNQNVKVNKKTESVKSKKFKIEIGEVMSGTGTRTGRTILELSYSLFSVVYSVLVTFLTIFGLLSFIALVTIVYKQPDILSGNYRRPVTPIARSFAVNSLDRTGFGWDWTQVLQLISIAQESYEKFDFESMECQKKAICELSQKYIGSQARWPTFTNLSRRVLNAVEELPMPSIILSHLKEYREAVYLGRYSDKDCLSSYPKCNFTFNSDFVQYQKQKRR